MVSKKTRIGSAKIPKPAFRIAAAKASRPYAVIGKKNSTRVPILAVERERRQTSKPFFSRKRRIVLGSVLRKRKPKKSISSLHS